MSSPKEGEHTSPAGLREPVNSHADITKLLKNSTALLRHDPIEALRLAQEGLALATERGSNAMKAESLLHMGNCNRFMARYEEALKNLENCSAIFARLGDEEKMATAQWNIGICLTSIDNFPEALAALHNSYKKFRDIGDARHMASTLLSVGNANVKLGDYKKALEAYLQSLALIDETDEPGTQADEERSERTFQLGMLLNNIGNIYLHLHLPEKALDFYQRSLTLRRADNDEYGEARTLVNISTIHQRNQDYRAALAVLTEALEKCKAPQNSGLRGSILINIGDAYRLMGDYEKALQHQREALQIVRSADQKSQEAIALINIGDIYRDMGQNPESLASLLQAKDIVERLPMPELQSSAHDAIAKTLKNLQQFQQSLEHYKLHSAIRKDIRNKEIQQSITELQYRFDVEKADREKELYRIRSGELAEALAQVEALNRTLLTLGAEHNEMLAIAAQDLKQPLKSIAAAIIYLTERFNKLTKDEVFEQLDYIEISTLHMSELITNLLTVNAIDTKRIAISLENCDMTALVTQIVATFKLRAAHKRISLIFNTPNAPLLWECDKYAFSRIIENLLSNAVKFSSVGGEISISLEKTDELFRTTIQDRGPGFTERDREMAFQKFGTLSAVPTDDENAFGLGLYIVKNLVSALGGEVRTENAANGGALVTVEFFQNARKKTPHTSPIIH